MSSFIFIVATSDYTANSSRVCPIINTDSSFTNLSSNIVNNADATTTITWSWSVFTDNGTTTDGLNLGDNANFTLNIASLNIIAFGSIPLSRNSGKAFYGFCGKNTATDVPIILSNTNFSKCFSV